MAFIVWARQNRRSDLLAAHLGATVHFIYFGRMAESWQTPARYLMQALQTWRVLYHGRPDVIFVQNPPIFLILVTFLYARLYGARYVIDSHTAAFVSPKWRWSLRLHRLLSRRALATIVHNKSQAELVSTWGCRYLVLAYTPGDYPTGGRFPINGQFSAAVVSSFNEDEPVGAVLEAARQLTDVCFYVTGDSSRLDPRLQAEKTDNLQLTGYLSYEKYVDLLRGVDVIVVLTTRHNSLLLGGFEAVSLGVPLIVSDWPLLRDFFSRGTVYVPNTAEGVCEGVRRAQREQAVLQRGILQLQQRLQIEWEQQFADLQQILGDA